MTKEERKLRDAKILALRPGVPLNRHTAACANQNPSVIAGDYVGIEGCLICDPDIKGFRLDINGALI